MGAGFLDIHAHILPGVDDGPASLEEALDLLAQMEADGIGTVVATPHFMPGYLQLRDLDRVAEGVNTLNRAAREAGLAVEVRRGGEVYLEPDLLEQAGARGLPVLEGSRKILVELPPAEIPWWTDEVLWRLQHAGYEPVLAHPENNSILRREPGILEGYLAQGILLQVEAGSLAGFFGERRRDFAAGLVRRGWCRFVASDTHPGRPPLMKKALVYLESKGGGEYTPLFMGGFL